MASYDKQRLALLYRRAATRVATRTSAIGCCQAIRNTFHEMHRHDAPMRFLSKSYCYFQAVFKPEGADAFWWPEPYRATREDQLARALALEFMACYIETDFPDDIEVY